MIHPNVYTKEMIREILGTSCPEWDPTNETGNQMRKRKGREMREGKRPYPTYPSKESRIADTQVSLMRMDNTYTQRDLDLSIHSGC